MTNPHSSDILPSVIEQHASEAAFLWSQRDRAVRSPHHYLHLLTRVDDRLDAHIDGLRIAGDFGWGLCLKGLEEGGPGDLFAASVLGFESGLEDRVSGLIEKGPTAPLRARAMVSALGWLPYERVKGVIAKLAKQGGPVPVQYVGIAAAAVHRRQPPFALKDALRGDPWLDARVFRAIGEMGDVNAWDSLKKGIVSADVACRFWAAWSGTLVFNEPAALAALQAIAEASGRFAEAAARVATRRMPPALAGRWVQKLAAEPRRLRVAVLAAGAAGDPDNFPWLIEQMRVPPLARVAGEAFALTAGVRVANEGLEGTKPEGFEAGPNDNPEDDNVAMDQDDNLAWPDADKVAAWWQANQSRFSKGTRYLLGQPMSVETAWHALRHGYQRQRAAAALELAIMQPGKPFFEVRAPGFRQVQTLSTG
jgi:uncharacterized protein (TIGR02270 family)